MSRIPKQSKKAYDRLQTTLCFEHAPGTAMWFLYLLDGRRLIERGNNVRESWITDKGSQLLDAIERYAPPRDQEDE
jgi:hypothetical protein